MQAPIIVQTPTNEYAIIAAVEGYIYTWSSACDIALELGVSRSRFLEVFLDDQLVP
jgi:hypothetical protein